MDREPVNRPANEADFRAGREQVIEVAEYAEEPVVSKQARVVEEVSVNKEASERTETVRDTVRHNNVEVENLTGKNAPAGTTGQTYNDDDFRKDFSSRYGASGGNYEDYAPAYRYGSDIANDPRYKGQDYGQIESQLRDDYTRRNPNSSWERVKDSCVTAGIKSPARLVPRSLGKLHAAGRRESRSSRHPGRSSHGRKAGSNRQRPGD